MTFRPPRSPGSLRIWQQNTRKLDVAQADVLAAASPDDWDVLAVQEPFLDRLGNTKASSYWRVLYPSTHRRNGSARSCSVILINTNISTESYSQLALNSNDITAVRFSSKFGSLSLFNIYNDCTNNDSILTLSTYLSTNLRLARPTGTDHMIWLGDFNRHHPLWEPEGNAHLFSSSSLIQPLLDLLSLHGMQQVLPPGIPTLQTVADRWTRPDNVWRSDSGADLVVFCDVVAALCPAVADHLPIVSVIEFPVPRAPHTPLKDFHSVDWQAFKATLEERLGRLPAVQITSPLQFHRSVTDFTSCIQDVIADNELVPLRRPCPHTKRWWNDNLKRLKAQRRRACNQAFKFHDVPNHPSKAEAA